MKPTKLSQRIESYLALQQVGCKPSTLRSYRTNLTHFHDYLKQIYRAPRIHKKHITQLTRSRLQGYLSYLNDKNLKPYTRVNYLLCVRKYLQWESEQGCLPEDRLALLDRQCLTKVPEYLPRPLTRETDLLLQQRLLQSSSPYAPAFLLLRHTGLRISELIQLPWDCVMTNPYNEPYLKVPLGKMDNERLVPLTQNLLELIETIKAAYPLRKDRCDQQHLLGLTGSVRQIYPYLVCRFQPFTVDLIDQNKPITFHRLRHTYATSLLTAGVSIVSLMKLLGHRRIEMTLRYTKVSPSHLRDEYLKAVQVMEQQTVDDDDPMPRDRTGHCHPAELIGQLTSFLFKAALVSPLQKKNLCLRLRRLQLDLSDIPLSEKFKLLLPRISP
jgi:site-specific recombinase XerD